MPVDITRFETIEEIDRFFRRPLQDAEADGGDALRDLRVEIAETKSSFLARQNHLRDLDYARMEAITTYPELADLRDVLRGDTPAEIKAAAEKMHTTIEARMAAAAPPAAEPTPEEAARAAYGNPAGGGGGQPIPETPPENERLKSSVRERLQRGMGMQDRKDDVYRFQSLRLGEAWEQARTSPTFKPTGTPKEDARRRA